MNRLKSNTSPPSCAGISKTIIKTLTLCEMVVLKLFFKGIISLGKTLLLICQLNIP